MYCPRCAKEFEVGTAYCRTCGLSLPQVSAIVTGERDSEPEMKSSPNRNLMRYGMACFMFGIIIALGNAMLKDLNVFPEAIGKYIFMSFVIIGMALLGAGILFPQTRYVKRKSSPARALERQPEIPATANLDRLPSADRSIDEIATMTNNREPDSVTEHTTRQLT